MTKQHAVICVKTRIYKEQQQGEGPLPQNKEVPRACPEQVHQHVLAIGICHYRPQSETLG